MDGRVIASSSSSNNTPVLYLALHRLRTWVNKLANEINAESWSRTSIEAHPVTGVVFTHIFHCGTCRRSEYAIPKAKVINSLGQSSGWIALFALPFESVP